MPTEAQLRDARLRQRIRELLDNGTLPAMISSEISAGYGSGKIVCIVCSQIIEPQQVDYEVRILNQPPLHFHLGCHALWQNECVDRLRPGDPSDDHV